MAAARFRGHPGAIDMPKVMSLQPGENDIRSVSPGIYFVRREEDNSTTKVVIQK